MNIVYFHRNKAAGFSINKVTQTIIQGIPNKKEYYMPYKGANLKSILGNLWFIYKHRDKNAINHITGDIHYGTLALIGCKSVLTIHDTFLLESNEDSFKKKIYKLLWFTLPLRLANRIICISKETKKCLEKISHRRDFVVIHNSTNIKPLTTTEIKTSKIPNILFIGTNPNKNLLRCFEALKDIDCRITIIGRVSEEQKQLLNELNIDHIIRFDLSDEEIIEEYMKCDIVSFISLFEGFGMPILEANSIGKPVIASDIPVLKEVGEDSVHFVDPYNIDNIHNGYKYLIENKAYRECLSLKGFENVKRFSTDNIRKQWIDLYNSI